MSIVPEKGYFDQVTVRLGANKERIQIIKTDEDLASVWKAAQQTGDCLHISLNNWKQWSPGFFWKLAHLVSSLGDQTQLQFKKEKIPGDLYDAFLALELGFDANDLVSFAHYKQLLLVAVYVFHFEVIGTCTKRIVKRFNDLGFVGENARGLAKEAKDLAAELSGARSPTISTSLVCEIFNDAPTPELVALPVEYLVSKDGIAVRGEGNFFPTPAVIVSRFVDVNSGLERVKLAWRRDGSWQSVVIPRKTVADSRLIVGLSDNGLPVTSVNAKNLIAYLAAFEAENSTTIPVESVTSRLGYHSTEDGPVFVLPGECIASNCAKIDFDCADEGLKQIAAGFKTGGSLEQWVAAVEMISLFPHVLLSMAASLATALSAFLVFHNLVIDFACPTSGGKTITLRFGASVWGVCDERVCGSLTRTWSITKSFVERAAGLTNDLPNIIDDSKNATDERTVADVVFMMASGHGKGRAKIEGLQTSEYFRTMCLSSGERPLTSFTKDGGTGPRVLSLWGSPFGGFSNELGALAGNFNQIIGNNYGFAGPTFVKFLLDNQELWPEWQEEFEFEKARYECWAKEAGNIYAGRMASSLAAITMALWLAHECFGFEFDYYDVIEPVWDEVLNSSSQANQSRAALNHVYELADSNREKFVRGSHAGRQPHDGWWGRWDEAARVPTDDALSATGATWPWIGFYAPKLDEILSTAGFETEAIIRTWHDAGWLATNEGNRRTFRSRVGSGGSLVRLICISREAIEEVCGL